MNEMMICVARPAHLAQVADLESMLNPLSPWNLSMINESILAGASVWVSMDGDQVAAYLVFDQLFEVSQILAVGVDEKYQRQGLARHLLEQYLSSRRKAGTTEVLLEVAATNRAAIALYQGLGFLEVGLRRGYYQELATRERTDALVLKCYL